MEKPELFLTRWHRAGLLDDSTVAAIRAYEEAQVKPGHRQWQVLLALILGGILLGAGVLLFVAAHWDRVSPFSRMCLVLAMLIFFHGLGLVVRERFAGLATAMHAVGTVSAGAAIALVGQIFNMQEHWPAAVLLWALCAAAGWWLLRDQFQETLTLLLVPAWMVCEWTERTSRYGGREVYIVRMVGVIGAVYLAAFLNSRKRAVLGILFGIGAVQLAISVGLLAEMGWQNTDYPATWGFVPLAYRLGAFAIILLALAFAWLMNKQSVLPVLLVTGMVWALPWTQKMVTEDLGAGHWTHAEPGLPAYGLVAAAAVLVVWWGVRIFAQSLVNYGMVAFAVTVIWFYFSSVMDKLGRSLG